MTLTYGDNFTAVKTKQQIYFKRQLYSGVVKQDQSVDLRLWFIKNTHFSSVCYFWTTSDGELPKPAPDAKLNTELINDLVRCDGKLALAYLKVVTYLDYWNSCNSKCSSYSNCFILSWAFSFVHLPFKHIFLRS